MREQKYKKKNDSPWVMEWRLICVKRGRFGCRYFFQGVFRKDGKTLLFGAGKGSNFKNGKASVLLSMLNETIPHCSAVDGDWLFLPHWEKENASGQGLATAKAIFCTTEALLSQREWAASLKGRFLGYPETSEDFPGILGAAWSNRHVAIELLKKDEAGLFETDAGFKFALEKKAALVCEIETLKGIMRVRLEGGKGVSSFDSHNQEIRIFEEDFKSAEILSGLGVKVSLTD